MKYVLSLSCSDEHADAPFLAVVDIDAERARKLLELHKRVIAFRESLDADGLACRFFTVSLGSDLAHFDGLRSTDELEERFDGGLAADTAEELPETFVANEEDHAQLECYRVELDERTIRFLALPKYHDAKVTTANLFDLVTKLAAQPAVSRVMYLSK
jgi:hypothetical protein